MEQDDSIAPAPYATVCYFCGAHYDVESAPSCSCIGKERSFVCPTCLKCFCSAPHSYVKEFWANAPQGVWDRRARELQSSPDSWTNPDLNEVERPLVLLVEDDEDVRAIAERVIRTLGYGLIIAQDGVEGLELAQQYHPDLVLSDALMPKLDGREMSLRIKSDPETADIKVVVMTSLYRSAHHRREALRDFRADEFLTKPVDVEKLRGTLQRYLD